MSLMLGSFPSGSQAEEWRSHLKGLASSSCLRGDWGKKRDRECHQIIDSPS